MGQETLAAILAYYRDLGVKSVYRRSAPAPVVEKTAEVIPAAVREPLSVAPPPVPPPPVPRIEVAQLFESELPGLAPVDDTLEKISADIGDCRRCRLCEGRNKIVFGSGNPQTKVVFVGEGPGEDEDIQGLPFVGRAGQLLTAMIDNTAKKEGIPITRSDVYICNVVKCRPPKNRAPEPDEMEICGQFLFRQLAVIKPRAICTLGATATKALLGKKEGVTKLRGNWFKWRDIPVMVTYHPSFLLRAYNVEAKREAWEDLKKVFHYVYD